MPDHSIDVDPRSVWLAATPSSLEAAQPFVCTEAGVLYGRGRFEVNREYKGSHLLIFTLKGAGVISQAGEEARVCEGDALLLDCRCPHRYRTAPDADVWEHRWAHISGPGVDGLASMMRSGTCLPSARVPFDLMQRRFDELVGLWGLEGLSQVAERGLVIHGMLCDLMDGLYAPHGQEADPLRDAYAFIESRYAEDIRVEDIAHASSVSTSHLNLLFRRQAGTTPHDYLVRYRVTRAKDLLANTGLPIAEIARRTGFNSESNFAYRFSKMNGVSPRSYRAEVRRGGAL